MKPTARSWRAFTGTSNRGCSLPTLGPPGCGSAGRGWVVHSLLGLILLGLLQALLVPPGAEASTLASALSPASCPVGQYHASYFTGTSLSGAPVVTRCEGAIQYDWYDGGPEGVGTDNFSARWVGRHSFNAGTSEFSATTDDGIRLWVDGQLLIDRWIDQGPTTYTASVSLTAGEHEVRVEYYENAGWAIAHVGWTLVSTPPPPSPTGCSLGQYQASYFAGKELSGSPLVTRCEGAIGYDWGEGGPDGVGTDNFSARWVGRHAFDAGTYEFTARADDGIRLWVNGQLLIDQWIDQAPTTYAASIALTAGEHEVRVEYYENAGGAVAQVGWTLVSGPPPPSGSTHSAPSLSAAPHHSGLRDVAQGSAAVSYSTPAYVSLDQPRSVSLTYIEAQARPTGFVQVDATDTSGTPPQWMSIQLRHLDGTPVTFTSGSQEIFYHAGGGTTRLAAQFDASGLEPRAYSFDVVVRSHWENGAVVREASSRRVRIPIVNERASPFGIGWSMPGLMRLYDQGDGVYITQGDGTGLWFERNAAGGYNAPEGDFSQVSWNGAGWTRRYPDGTEAEFGASGYLNIVRDRFDNRTWYGYDTSVWPHRLIFIEDPVGKRITFGYTGGGALAWIQDPGGRRVNTAPNGNILHQFYDPDGVLGLDMHFDHGPMLLGYWDRGVNRNTGDATRWHFDYDAHGKLARVTTPQVNTTDAGWTRPVTSLRSLEAAVLPASRQGQREQPRRSSAVRGCASGGHGSEGQHHPDDGGPLRAAHPH